MPGLEDHEFGIYSGAYTKCVRAAKEYRIQNNASIEEIPTDEVYRPAIDKYRELTGYTGSDAFHMYRKHRVSSFTLVCKACDLWFYAPATKKCPCCGKVCNT